MTYEEYAPWLPRDTRAICAICQQERPLTRWKDTGLDICHGCANALLRWPAALGLKEARSEAH